MEFAEKLVLRADTAAEAHLAETLQKVYAGTVERLSDEDVDALRETFKIGFLTGYRASLKDLEDQMKGLIDD